MIVPECLLSAELNIDEYANVKYSLRSSQVYFNTYAHYCNNSMVLFLISGIFAILDLSENTCHDTAIPCNFV